MFLKKIALNHYGPISSQQLDIGKGIQIIWGPNEAGKTLTIDAVLKLMLGKSARDFNDIDRVNQLPDGYLLLEEDQGQQLKIDSANSLSKFIGISPRDVRNIMVIRNSDLSLDLEADYYRTVTDRLTGLQTERIEKLAGMFRQYGRLTEQGSLSNSREHGYIKNKREEAKQLKKEIGSYLSEAQINHLDELEVTSLRLSKKLGETKQQLAEYDRLAAFNDFKQLEDNIAQLKILTGQFQQYQKYTQESYNHLLKLKSDISTDDDNIKVAAAESSNLDKTIDGLAVKKGEVESKLKPLDDKAKNLVELKEELAFWQHQNMEAENKVFLWVSLALLAMGFISLVPLIMYQVLAYLWLPLILVFLFLAFFGFYWYQKQKYRSYLLGLSKLLDKFSRWGIKAQSLREAAVEISRFEEQKQILEEEKLGLEKELDIRRGHRQSLAADTKRHSQNLSDSREQVSDILNQLGVESEQALAKKLEEKRDIQYRAGQVFQWLNQKFELSYENENDMDYIGKKLIEIDSLAQEKKPQGYSSNQVLRRIDQKYYQQLKQELTELEVELGENNKKLEDHQFALRDMQKKLDNLEIECSNIEIDNLAKLPKAAVLLEDFAAEIDRRAEAAEEAIAILGQISQEEQLKVSDIFETLSASDYFHQVTGCRYSRIYYEPEQKKVKVVNRKGESLEATQLSRGTYDQLYLAIRVALAQKVFTEPSFFILDDAFIYSDTDRLKQQFELLASLAQEGWSFIYFTVKDEIKQMAGSISSHHIISMEGN